MAGETVSFDGEQYRLRAGSPMPTDQGIVLQTFGAEKTKITVILYTQTISSSNDFRGQGGDLISASYSRLSDKGGDSFQGKLTYSPEYVDEDSI